YGNRAIILRVCAITDGGTGFARGYGIGARSQCVFTYCAIIMVVALLVVVVIDAVVVRLNLRCGLVNVIFVDDVVTFGDRTVVMGTVVVNCEVVAQLGVTANRQILIDGD